MYRIGLHLGDLIVDGVARHGDGVDVAARLAAEAPPGGVMISRTIHEAIVGRVKWTLPAAPRSMLNGYLAQVVRLGTSEDTAFGVRRAASDSRGNLLQLVLQNLAG